MRLQSNTRKRSDAVSNVRRVGALRGAKPRDMPYFPSAACTSNPRQHFRGECSVQNKSLGFAMSIKRCTCRGLTKLHRYVSEGQSKGYALRLGYYVETPQTITACPFTCIQRANTRERPWRHQQAASVRQKYQKNTTSVRRLHSFHDKYRFL